jgi:hypothetical protein
MINAGHFASAEIRQKLGMNESIFFSDIRIKIHVQSSFHLNAPYRFVMFADELKQLWELLLSKLADKGMKLQQALILVQFLRQCDEVMFWINDKVRTMKSKRINHLSFVRSQNKA